MHIKDVWHIKATEEFDKRISSKSGTTFGGTSLMIAFKQIKIGNWVKREHRKGFSLGIYVLGAEKPDATFSTASCSALVEAPPKWLDNWDLDSIVIIITYQQTQARMYLEFLELTRRHFHAGTVFLWMFWPSFNSAEQTGDDQQRAVINTNYL